VTVIPLRREPAYTPMGPPGRCMTPGHEDIAKHPARPYPGGLLCKDCLPVRSVSEYRNDNGGDPR
jgi:hypothetical protein